MNEHSLMKLEVETGLQVTPRQLNMLQYADRVMIGIARKEGWTGELPFYIFNCKRHGVVVNHSQDPFKTLKCPECGTPYNDSKGNLAVNLDTDTLHRATNPLTSNQGSQLGKEEST